MWFCFFWTNFQMFLEHIQSVIIVFFLFFFSPSSDCVQFCWCEKKKKKTQKLRSWSVMMNKEGLKSLSLTHSSTISITFFSERRRNFGRADVFKLFIDSWGRGRGGEGAGGSVGGVGVWIKGSFPKVREDHPRKTKKDKHYHLKNKGQCERRRAPTCVPAPAALRTEEGIMVQTLFLLSVLKD